MYEEKYDLRNLRGSSVCLLGPAEKMFFKTIVDAGKNLGYIYYAEGTDKTVEVVHANAELAEIFK